jgi:pimeloyl-ACP methyl ester carboxylesterase
MAYASVHGLELYYEIHGTGKPLVALHGGLLTIDLTFGAILPSLAESHQVIAVELQGHGHTADTDRELTFPNLASDVVALLDHLGIERADIFGFSLGGLTAIQTAITYPDRVNRLVLAGTHFRTSGYHDDIRDPEKWATSTRMPTENDFKEMQDAYARVAPDPSHFQAFMAKASAAPDTVDEWASDDLRAITAPALIIVGDNDFVRIEHAAEMRDLIPRSQLAVLPGTSHMTVMRRIDLLCPLVEGFLRD